MMTMHCDCVFAYSVSDDQAEYQFSSDERKNGTFSSPGFPESYPDGGTIRYTFIGKGRERVQLIFTELDLNIVHEDSVVPLVGYKI